MLTPDERKALETATERTALAVTSKAAVAWGMPLLDILKAEGHAHDCDALVTENTAHCDCWWIKVRRAAEALSLVATTADETLALLGEGDLIETVEQIIRDRPTPPAKATP